MERGRNGRTAAAALLIGIGCLVAAVPAAALPPGLDAPDQRVVCHRERQVCYDRYGPSIGLTQAFLGQAAADRLTALLRASPGDAGAGAVFSPAEGVECVRETGPCTACGQPDAELNAALFGPWPPRTRDAAASIVGSDWRWLASRYGNDTQARPAEPARYILRLEPDGSVRARLDCNRAGGRYRLDESRIMIELTHSTMAACEAGSLDTVFRRDLSTAAIYFLRNGRLYLDLRYDSGTMEFER